MEFDKIIQFKKEEVSDLYDVNDSLSFTNFIDKKSGSFWGIDIGKPLTEEDLKLILNSFNDIIQENARKIYKIQAEISYLNFFDTFRKTDPEASFTISNDLPEDFIKEAKNIGYAFANICKNNDVLHVREIPVKNILTGHKKVEIGAIVSQVPKDLKASFFFAVLHYYKKYLQN